MESGPSGVEVWSPKHWRLGNSLSSLSVSCFLTQDSANHTFRLAPVRLPSGALTETSSLWEEGAAPLRWASYLRAAPAAALQQCVHQEVAYPGAYSNCIPSFSIPPLPARHVSTCQAVSSLPHFPRGLSCSSTGPPSFKLLNSNYFNHFSYPLSPRHGNCFTELPSLGYFRFLFNFYPVNKSSY